jgi:hypothetical protein
MESLSRYREPAAGLAIAALGLNIAVGLIGAFFSPVSLPDMAVGTAYRVGDPVFVGAVAALTATCVVRSRTAHARVLTVLGLLTCAVALLLGVLFAVVGLAWRPPGETLDVLGVFPLLVLSAVGVGTLAVLLGLQRAHAGQTVAVRPAVGEDTTQAALPVAPVPVLDPALQPTWAPDAAAGAAWHRAGDAASGAPASGWGGGSATAGWQPIPAEPIDPVAGSDNAWRNPAQRPPGPVAGPGSDPAPR